MKSKMRLDLRLFVIVLLIGWCFLITLLWQLSWNFVIAETFNGINKITFLQSLVMLLMFSAIHFSLKTRLKSRNGY